MSVVTWGTELTRSNSVIGFQVAGMSASGAKKALRPGFQQGLKLKVQQTL